MNKLVVSLGLIAAMAAAATLPANAAPKKCKAGTTWNKAAGKCVAARASKPATVKKAEASCLSFTDEGGITSRPCAN